MKLLSLILAIGLLAGCQFAGTTAPTTQRALNAGELAVRIGVGGVIVASTNPGTEAARIYRAATELKSIADSTGDVSTLESLIAQVSTKFDIGPDRDRAVFIVTLVFSQVQSQLGTSATQPILPAQFQDARYVVSDLAEVAQQTSGLYLTSQGLPLPH